MEEEWYREEFLTRHPEAVDAEVKADTAAHQGASHERAGNVAADRAAAAYGTAEHRAALEQQLVTAGVPDQAVKARTQGEKIQKYPITHAAAGKGAKAGKTRGAPANQAQAQSKNRTRPLRPARHRGAPHTLVCGAPPLGQKCLPGDWPFPRGGVLPG